MKKSCLVLLLTFGALQLFAADVSGSWKLNTKAGRRKVTLQLMLRQQGSSLSGTVAGPRRTYPIVRGVVDSDNHIKMALGGEGPLAGATMAGTVEGDHMRLTIQTEKGQSEGVAVKSQ